MKKSGDRVQGIGYRKKTIAVFVFLLSTVNCQPSTLLCADELSTYDAKGKRDPFLPLVTKDGRIVSEHSAVERAEDIKLQGIIWDPRGKSFAMLNGEVVSVGDLLGGFRMIKIEQRSVTLESSGKEYKISLEE